MARFLRDERGAVAVQVALMLPIFIVILWGAFEVWKVLYTQQMLNDAAYQGTRLMVLQANSGEMDVPGATKAMVRRYVSQSPYVGSPSDVNVIIDYQSYPPKCGTMVAVQVELPWRVGMVLDREAGGWRDYQSSGDSGWLSFLNRSGSLVGRAEGAVLCEREEDVIRAGL